MLGDEVVDEGFEFWKIARSREEMLFFRVEVIADFLIEVLLNLGLPRLQFCGAREAGTVDADTQGERVLVLAGQRDEVFVA